MKEHDENVVHREAFLYSVLGKRSRKKMTAIQPEEFTW